MKKQPLNETENRYIDEMVRKETKALFAKHTLPVQQREPSPGKLNFFRRWTCRGLVLLSCGYVVAACTTLHPMWAILACLCVAATFTLKLGHAIGVPMARSAAIVVLVWETWVIRNALNEDMATRSLWLDVIALLIATFVLAMARSRLDTSP